MTNTASRRHPHEPEIPPTLDGEGRCLVCALIVERDKARARALEAAEEGDRLAGELDSTYRHLRAVAENCKHSAVGMIRHQLVGLLPECQEMEPEHKAALREAGMGELVERHDENVRRNWAEYGYGDPPNPPQGGRS